MKIILILLIGISISVKSQNKTYWISFTDKNSSNYSTTVPLAFLSQKSIDRRNKSGISIVQNDLPVNRNYIDSILNTGNIQLLVTSKWMNAVAINTSDTLALNAIQNFSFVSGVIRVKTLIKNESFDKFEEIAPIKQSFILSNNPNYPYGVTYNQLALHDADKMQDLGFKGQGIHIAILDAGFFRANELDALSETFNENRILSTYDFVNIEKSVYEDHSHGAMVLSVIAGSIDGVFKGTAPKASFHLLRTEDANTETLLEEYNWIAAAEYADSAGVDIINTSLGYATFDDSTQNHTYADMDGNTTIIAKAADIAASKGILLCISAGNAGASAWKYIATPADADSVLAVAAVDSNGIRASFSSIGPASDGDIKPNVASVGWNTYLISPFTGEVFRGSGTSFSAPMMTGMAACLWQALPNKTNMEIQKLIEESSSQFTSPDSLLGYGIPNIMDAYVAETGIFYKTPTNNNIEAVFPNPVADLVNFIFVSKANQDIVLRLYSVKGDLIISEAQSVLVGKNKLTLKKLDKLTSGNYIIEIHTDEGRVTTSKIVVI